MPHKKTEKTPKNSLEDNIKHLELIAKNIERGDLSINDVVEKYKEATKIIKECKNEIEKIENTIIEIDAKNI